MSFLAASLLAWSSALPLSEFESRPFFERVQVSPDEKSHAVGNTLKCIQQSYQDDQKERLTALLTDLDPEGEELGSADEELALIISVAGEQCATEWGWSDTQFESAFYFEFGRIYEAAYRQYGPLSAEAYAKIETALASGENADFWKAIENQVASGLTGKPASNQRRDEMVMGVFLLRNNLVSSLQEAEQVGVFLGYVAMQRLSLRAFAAEISQEN